MLPDQDFAVGLLTNGGNAGDLYADLFREVFAEIAGIEMPPPFVPPVDPPAVEVEPYLGVYERASVRFEILRTEAGGGLLRSTVTGLAAALTPNPVEECPMVAVAPGLFAIKTAESESWSPVIFYDSSRPASGSCTMRLGYPTCE